MNLQEPNTFKETLDLGLSADIIHELQAETAENNDITSDIELDIDPELSAETSTTSANDEYQKKLNERAEQLSRDAFKQIPHVDFQYNDKPGLRWQLEEWFVYEDQSLFQDLIQVFSKTVPGGWAPLDSRAREELLVELMLDLESSDINNQKTALQLLLYILLGYYAESESVEHQISCIQESSALFSEMAVVSPVYDLIRYYLSVVQDSTESLPDSSKEWRQAVDANLFYSLTILYILLCILVDSEEFIDQLDGMDVPILLFFVECLNKLRWKTSNELPLRNISLVIWRTIQCLFGDFEKLALAKSYMRKLYNIKQDSSSKLAPASPLDYHAFRKDICSRYPTYVPPPSLLPDELENPQSISYFIQVPRPLTQQTSVASLPTPPINIATPAPCPPFVPAPIPGQKAKRATFQTNQSVPLIYPSKDKVPYSIQEAGEIFSSSVRTSVGMRQLWKERDLFMKQERGWVSSIDDMTDDFAGLELGSGSKSKNKGMTDRENEEDSKEKSIRKALMRVEKFYGGALPSLSAFVNVLMKIIIASVLKGPKMTDLGANPGRQNSIDLNEKEREAINVLRANQITLEAASSIMLMLAQWFKALHIMKFEYFSTIVFDLRFYVLVNGYLTRMDDVMEHVVTQYRISDLEMFSLCRSLSKNPESENELYGMMSSLRMENYISLDDVRMCETIKWYSWSFMFSVINLVKLVKLTVKKKTQRIMFLAEIKASDSLKKLLRVYQKDLWAVVLNVIKQVVPFNGRKWKISNMDLISAIFLHCKLGLRDEWLTGNDINSELEDAYPQEVAMRALTQFYNFRKYPKEMARLGYERKDAGFFAQELEGMAWENGVKK